MSTADNNIHNSDVVDQVFLWLNVQKEWSSKSANLNGCGTAPEAWSDAINELLNDDYIETRGNESNSTYRANHE